MADFEGGVPAEWFQYGDGGTVVNTEVITVPNTDPMALPGQMGANGILSVTANVPSWAGFGAALNPVQDWSDYDAVSFWYYGTNISTTHEFEIQTVQGVDRRVSFVDNFMGWRQLVFPFTTFGAGGAYDVSQVDNWVFVLDGTVGSFKMDTLQLVNLQPFADFEVEVPAGWFQYGDGGTVINAAVMTVTEGQPMAVPGQVGSNGILSVTANVPTWAGFGAAFSPVMDWSEMQGISFWFYGTNISTTHEFELQTAQNDDRRVSFVDNFSGWRLINFPFTAFGSTPYDVSQVDNWVLVMDGTVGAFALDHLSVYGDAGNAPLRVQFDPNSYTVTEGETVTVTVALNMTSTNTVTVTYAMTDGTATAGADYTATTGSLVFAPGDLTKSFTVSTIEDATEESDETVNLTLSNPISVELGSASTAILTIKDDDQVLPTPSVIVDDFENGLPTGQDSNSLGIGFVTFGQEAGATVSITTTEVADSDPLALPEQSGANTVFELEVNAPSYGGATHAFENAAVDTWTPQDWSAYEGITFWIYGQNTGKDLLFEVNENRNPGSTKDDAERWSHQFKDDFSGWKQIALNFQR